MADLKDFDPYHSFIATAHAFRRNAERNAVAMGANYGIAAHPLPFQLATVNKILTDLRIRHLIADEVGLGKTIQAIMILNALFMRDVGHSAVIVAPERLLGQWQEELWTRGHTLAHLISPEDQERMSAYREFLAENTIATPRNGNLPHPSERFSDARIMLLRPQDVRDQPEWLAPESHKMLVIDEPQALPRDTLRRLQVLCNPTLTENPTFRQLLILSATPRLGDAVSLDTIFGFIEPERMALAEAESQDITEWIDGQERAAIEKLIGQSSDEIARGGNYYYTRFARTRRISRQTRSQWGDYFPRRKSSIVFFQPLASECRRLDLIDYLLDDRARASRSIQEGQPWETVRALLRSRRSVREAIDRLDRPPEWAADVRQSATEDFGDSRLDALLDILSRVLSTEIGILAAKQRNPPEKVVIVAGDARTIDMLNTVLPRYFPALLDGGIATLKRVASGSESTFDDIQQMQETLKPFTEGDAKVLLLGDWVQAGLNLQHSARNLIFYSLPWDALSIDQLIGRIDRLSHASIDAAFKGNSRAGSIRIWQLVMRHSPEERLAEAMKAIGVFDNPLPQISEEAWAEINSQFVQVISGSLGQCRAALARMTEIADSWSNRGFSSKLDHFDPLSVPLILKESAKVGEVAGLFALPTEAHHATATAIELVNWDWLRASNNSGGFQFADHSGHKSGLSRGYHSLWYRSQHAIPPFYLPSMANSQPGEDKQFFLLRRKEMTSPPAVDVAVSHDGEVRKLLHFFDHGAPLHDQFLKGWLEFGKPCFSTIPRNEILVRISEDHPASVFATRPVVVTLAASAEKPTGSMSMSPDLDGALVRFSRAASEVYIAQLADGLQADRRWLVAHFPARASFRASVWHDDQWQPIPQEDAAVLLRAFPGTDLKSKITSTYKTADMKFSPVCETHVREMHGGFEYLRKKTFKSLLAAWRLRSDLISAEAEDSAKLYEARAETRGQVVSTEMAAARRGLVDMDLHRATLMRLIGKARTDALKQLLETQTKPEGLAILHVALRFVVPT